MPTHLDFDSTKGFRDILIGKTLNAPNGPQTFTSQNYLVQKPGDLPNVDPGDVTTNLGQTLSTIQGKNIFKPFEYWVTEYLRDIPRRANLNLYPYFIYDTHNLISIMTRDNYDTESELMKFAASNIKNNENGPVLARIQQNLYAATVGRVRLIDALGGNTSTAINLITGRESLIEFNNKITVAKSTIGKGVDFLQTVAGVEFPYSEIPGDYLANPMRPVVNRPEPQSEVQAIWQDVTGGIGSIFGIQRRPLDSRKPSDLFLDYTGQASKQALYNNLSYSKYAPDYTTTARSQNSSKIFSFIDKFSEGIRKLLGLEAPNGMAYIGDDRGNDVKYAMGDFNDNLVRSPWYLNLMFDPIQTRLFQRERNVTEGGEIGGRLVWISKNSKNKIGKHNEEYPSESADFENALSTKYTFRDGSILSRTQDILNTMPNNGAEARSHVANAIDQTSRIFREGDFMISRGSAIKYVDQFTREESGVEYCRVWTKDRSYYNMSDLMKKTPLIRGVNIPEESASVLDTPYNLNIYPNSNGNKDFQGSTNIVEGSNGFFAKKYMFSIENLAWKTSNVPGFMYGDLPYCERGPNGGRVMWFPPYDLKVTEQNQARWEENNFLGRPEPVYTYQNTTRNGNVSFKVIVDHPSILNLLTREEFKNMSDEEADNYINAFFAGCENVDFYDLIRKYTTLDKDDVKRIQDYLNAGKDPNTITTYKAVLEPTKDGNAPDVETPTGGNGQGDGSGNGNIEGSRTSFTTELYFQNDTPEPKSGQYSNSDYTTLYDNYINYEEQYKTDFTSGFITLTGFTNIKERENDLMLLVGQTNVDATKVENWKTLKLIEIEDAFDRLEGNYNNYDSKLSEIKQNLKNKKVSEIEITIESSASSVAETEYNENLSYRRSHAIIKDIFNKLKANNDELPSISWDTLSPIPLKNLGYPDATGNLVFKKVNNLGETLNPNNTIYEQDKLTQTADCINKYFYTSGNLRKTAPITFYCRQSKLNITTSLIGENQKPAVIVEPVKQDNPNISKVLLIPNTQTPIPNRKPPLDELKRIVMKTLSECYYFKKFEEDSPVAFGSMREKLRYFHPAFHSMTPEGLNSRLTFLQQCIRPGDTIPIKGISDVNDLNARNTTFGPPPVCVMRIGDFYHSKVIIRDVNFEFEDNLWDLNPEGIGIQPMIANVTLQVSFIGGHGLERPVEMLQNALTSNFYANTEMYDYRATATENRNKYTKEFLEELMKTSNTVPIPNPDINGSDNIATGQYIGIKTTVYDVSTLEYRLLIDLAHVQLIDYFTAHRDALEYISSKYGRKIASMFFSPLYRPIKDYIIYSNPSTTETIELLGEYDTLQSKDFGHFLANFDLVMNNKVQNTNITELIGLDKEFNEGLKVKSEQYLKSFIGEKIIEWIDEFSNNSSIWGAEKTRNSLISTLDKLNFVTRYETDGYLTNNMVVTGVTFTNYTNFYEKYEKVVEHISDHYEKFTEDLDTSFLFTAGVVMSDEVFSEVLSNLLYDYKEEIMDLYLNDSYFTKSIDKINKRLNRFLTPGRPISIKLNNFPKQKNTNPLIFTIQDELRTFNESETDEFKKIMSNSVPLGATLNLYKP